VKSIFYSRDVIALKLVVNSFLSWGIWKVYFIITVSSIVVLAITSNLGAESPKDTTRLGPPANKGATVCIHGKTSKTDEYKIGLGFFVNENGYIVTAKHVVIGTRKLFVVPLCIDNGERKEAKLIATSPTHDIAIIRIDPKGLPSPKCFPVAFPEDSTLILRGSQVEIQGWDCSKQEEIWTLGHILKIFGKDSIEVGAYPVVKKGFSGSPMFFKGTDILIGCQSTANQVELEVAGGIVEIRFLAGPYGAVHVKSIQEFLDKNEIPYQRRHFDAQTSPGMPKYRGNPIKMDERSWFIGMLELIQYSIKDAVNKFDLFEAKDLDILVETALEASSLWRKLIDTTYQLDDSRQTALFFFIKGLAAKISGPDGFKASRQYFERALYEDSGFADARYQVASYHIRCTGDTLSAWQHLAEAMKSDSSNGELLRTVVLYYLHIGNMSLAEKYLRKAETLLGKDDPRIPFYFALVHDPYWLIIWPMDQWAKQFEKLHDREPDLNEVQDKREELLSCISEKDSMISLTKSYYKESMRREPGYVRPLNSLTWILANEAMNARLSGTIPLHLRVELEEALQKMSAFVRYGLFDPRPINTLAMGYAALDDCTNACRYWRKSLENMKKLKLSPSYEGDLIRENERVSVTCHCTSELFEENFSFK
jgi:tetratricopeptide (TPR) repeat protein